jgi:hypothetical protein
LRIVGANPAGAFDQIFVRAWRGAIAAHFDPRARL